MSGSADIAAQEALIGQLIGNYEVVQKLGEGGMGSVYLARHPRIGKEVALKVLHPEFASDQSIVDRFFTEAKSVNDIGHPNIVDIIDYGEWSVEDGKSMVYFFMEFLRGQSLTDLIASEAPLDPDRAFRICAQVADALAASHRAGVVHRDLKPDNLFLVERRGQNDVIKVLDFGIAKLTGDQPGSRRTRTGVVIGTPYYMSPEQCEGKGNVDHRSDVYALGVVLYEMVVGRVPFEGEGYGEILVQHLTQAPPRPSQLRPGLSPYVEVVILKALEKNRDNRYSSMDEFHQALVDPVGFLNARGGPQAFIGLGVPSHTPGAGIPVSTQNTLSSQPVGAVGTPAPTGGYGPTPTPTPGAMTQIGVQQAMAMQNTPVPGSMMAAGAYGYQTPAPGYGPLDSPPKSKMPVVVGAGVGAVALVGIAIFALTGKGEPPKPSEPTAQAAPVPPVEAPADKNPDKVELQISTRPDGADVFVAGESTSRGTTPTSVELDKSSRSVTVVIRKDGFREEKRLIVPDRQRALDLSLSPEPTASATPLEKPERKRRDSRRSNDSRDSGKTKSGKSDKKDKFGDDILAPDL
jgi:eukaryotic-like serine/threonine-protein kinase